MNNEYQLHRSGQTINLLVVYPVVPLPASFDQWRKQPDANAGMVRRHGSRGVILVGDIDATGKEGFRHIVGQGPPNWAALHPIRFEMVCSQLCRPLQQLIQMDQLLKRRGLFISRIGADIGPDGDHRVRPAEIGFGR